MKRVRLLLLTTAAAIGWQVQSEAQMFAPRPVGNQATSGSFPGGPGTTAGGGAGSGAKGAITPNSRFVRGGRDPNDFVGTDSGDRRRFVGANQAAANRRARALIALTTRAESSVNQGQNAAETNSPTTLYPPRLTLGDGFTEIQPAAVQSNLQRRLTRYQSLRSLGPVEISVEGRTAILRGTVASAKERALAELLVQLEPGISTVQNDLTVKPAAERIANPPSLPEVLPAAPPRPAE